MIAWLPFGLLAATTLAGCGSAGSTGQDAATATRWSGPAAWDVASPAPILRRPATGGADAAPSPAAGDADAAEPSAPPESESESEEHAGTEEAPDARAGDASPPGQDPSAPAGEADDGDDDVARGAAAEADAEPEPEPQAETGPAREATGGGRGDDDRPAGLVVEELAAGDGPAADGDDLVRLRLEGRLPDGTVVDSDAGPRGPWPVDALIEGLAAGIRGMRVGGRRRLEIPPALGYGDEPVLDASGETLVPAGATLVYEVELLEIVGAGDASDPGVTADTGGTEAAAEARGTDDPAAAGAADAAAPGADGSEEDAP